jgi:hypothetical protein
MELYFIFIFLIGGVGYTSYKIGVREGSERMIDKLHEIGVITYDEKGRIKPNPFFGD